VFARRGFLLGALAVGGLAAARWFNVGANLEGPALSVREAHIGAFNGDITLVDIRRPDEWARTGIPEGAITLDMRDPAFVTKLLAQISGLDAPVALICARGVRSRHLADRLNEAGFTNIIDVPEGMLGSGAGPGWLAAGLPVTAL
jgi:rhodanese-related sulfurtransferase